jgi:prevent-host-death family protein
MKKSFSNTISSFEAKTHFSNLIQRVKDGEKFTILKHNAPIAIIAPVTSAHKSNIEEIVNCLKDFRKDKKLNGLAIKELINEGRK